MSKRSAITAAVGAVIIGGTGVATVVGGVSAVIDTPIIGSPLSRASDAALDAVGGGRVTDTEVGDEDGYYEVEVTLEDSRQVDVQLDRNFDLVTTMSDREYLAPGR
jgi:hypothetical protein